ncbi:RNA-binding protein pop5 [Tilletia horrida]|nr:RNA-binding protein pop5 [Tilletia horrida]
MVRFKVSAWAACFRALVAVLTTADITKLLRISLQFNFGDLGIGAHGGNAQCRYYSPALRTAIIRCARESAKVVWAAVTLITEHRGRRVRPRVIHVGGTIKKVQLRAMGLDRAAISNLQTVMAQTGPEIGDEDDLAANLQPPNSLDVLEDVGAPLDMALAVGPLSTPATGAGAGADANDNDDLGEPISSLGEVIPRDQFPPIT